MEGSPRQTESITSNVLEERLLPFLPQIMLPLLPLEQVLHLVFSSWLFSLFYTGKLRHGVAVVFTKSRSLSLSS